MPLEPACLDLVVVADALHFLDTELTARQIARVLVPRGALALVTCQFADTPFMRGVRRLMEEAAPRRPRALTQSIVHLSALSGVALTNERRFHDETPIDHATLERILRSISSIGPAMNPARFAAFRARVHALPDAPVWARTFVLRSGHRAAARSRAGALSSLHPNCLRRRNELPTMTKSLSLMCAGVLVCLNAAVAARSSYRRFTAGCSAIGCTTGATLSFDVADDVAIPGGSTVSACFNDTCMTGTVASTSDVDPGTAQYHVSFGGRGIRNSLGACTSRPGPRGDHVVLRQRRKSEAADRHGATLNDPAGAMTATKEATAASYSAFETCDFTCHYAQFP